MKAALIAFDFAEFCIPLANSLAHAGASVLFMMPEQEMQSRLDRLRQNVRFHGFHKPRLRQPAQQVRLMASLIRQIQAFRPDVIHLQGGHLWFNLALPLLRHYPLVVSIHDIRHHAGDQSSQRTPQRVLEISYRRAHQIIVHGERLKRDVIDYLHVTPDRVHAVPLVMVDYAGESPVPCDDDRAEVLFFGRIWQYKGLEYLIRAEPLITQHAPNTRIIIAGEGEDFARYRQMMTHPDRFLVHNTFISDHDRSALFARASIVALPYIEASQSGVVPLAYSFSKPVVATTVGGLPDVIDDGKTGFLVPPRDEHALANAVVRLLADNDLRQQMGRNGRHKMDTEYSPAAVARQTLDVYRQALTQS